MTPCSSLAWSWRESPDCWEPRSAPWVTCADTIFWCVTWRSGIRAIAPCNQQRVLLDVPGTSYGARRPPTLKLYPTRQDALRALVLEALDDSTPF